MRIYIRHAEKEYCNGQSTAWAHDPSITSTGYEQTQKLALQLIEQWGIPNFIICSPYRRTRETALALLKIINNNGLTELKYDVRLSEYLGNRRNEKLDVTNETLEYNPPHPETFFQMDTRVRWHNDDMKALDHENTVVWFISHGFIINRIGNAMGYKLPKRLPYLSTVIFFNKQCNLFLDSKLELLSANNILHGTLKSKGTPVRDPQAAQATQAVPQAIKVSAD